MLVVVVLIALVVAVIKLMDPAKEFRTHFVQMNLLKSGEFSAPPGIRPTEDLFQKTSRRKFTEYRTESLAFSSADGSDSDNMKKAHVVVIALQTTFVPGPDGQFKCLIRNSTPNLDNPNQYTELKTLKHQLDEFQKQQAETRILLLVDSPSVNSEWRAGSLHAGLYHEFEQWVTDLEHLVVVLSSDEYSRSELGASGTEERSIFGHFASIGFSSLGDLDSNTELTASEYCTYVAKRTDDWVRTHRNLSGQKVQILPSADFEKNKRDFPLLTELVTLPVSMKEIGSRKTVDVAELSKQWNLRQSLKERGGDYWNPILWRSATDKLLRAETASLHGQSEIASRMLKEATDILRELEGITNEICPATSAFNSDRGLVISDFAALPSIGRVNSLFSLLPDRAPVASGALALAEDVLTSHVRKFPYSQLGMMVPSEDTIEALRARRARAEEAIAFLVAVSHRIPMTVRRLDADLLLTEDRLFTRPSVADTAAQVPSPDELIRAINAFSEIHDRSERTLAGLLDVGPSLATWASLAGNDLSESNRSLWTKILSSNSPELPLEMNASTDSLNTLFDPLKSLDDTDAEKPLKHESTANDLRKESFRLLVHARGLQKSLLFTEPSDGFRTEDLQVLTERLRSWERAASESLTQIAKLSEAMCTIALQNIPSETTQQVRTYHFLNSTLCLTMIPPQTRDSVLRAMQELDGKFVAAEKTSESAASPTPAVDTVNSAVFYEACWLLQVLNLLPSSEKQLTLIQEAWKAANGLQQGETSEQHNALARFGDSVRSAWKNNHYEVNLALQDTSRNALEGLRTADQRTRLFSGFDAQSKSLRSLAQRFRQLKRIHYCLMHADRLISGLWTEPEDLKPWSQTGWYSRLGQVWITTVGSQAHERMANEPLGAFPFITEHTEHLKARLAASEQLSLVVVPKQKELNLGEQDHGTITARVARASENPIAGEAAILTRLENNSPVVVTNNGLPLSVGADGPETQLEIRRTGAAGRDDCRPVLLNAEIFFRGRYWKSETDLIVDPCAPAEYVLEKTIRDETVQISVSGSDPRPIVLILDFSGSMTEVLSGTETPRFLEALATLEGLINSDEVFGARVILNVYGHRTKRVTLDGKHAPNPKYAEFFGRNVPETLQADLDIETVFDDKIIDGEKRLKFKEVLEKLKGCGPWGSTPLTRSISDAITDTLKDKAGIVIAVSDGEAKDFKGKPLADLKRAIADHPATSVRIVAFDVKSVPEQRQELDKNFGQFETIKIVDASEREQLLAEVYASLDPRKFSATWQAGAQTVEAALGSAMENLKPDSDYTLRFDQIVTEQPIALNRGDMLKADIDHTSRRFLFRRDKRAVMQVSAGTAPTDDTPTILRSTRPVQRWDIPGKGSSEMKRVELSLMLDHVRDELPVRQPAEIEFEIRPAGSTSKFRPPGIVQRYYAGTGAPGWQIVINEWPVDQLFLVDSVWKMVRTSPEKVIRWTELKQYTSADNSLRSGGNGLPDYSVWVTLRGNELQVRLDPVGSKPRPEGTEGLGDRWARNLVEDIRVEIGQRYTSDQDASFRPWEINTRVVKLESRVVKLESGSVRYEFSGDKISPDDLMDAEIALTSAAARNTDALTVSGFQID